MTLKKESLKTFSAAAGGIVVSHIICCAPLVAAAVLGVTLSASFVGVASLAGISIAYATAYQLYKRKPSISVKKQCCAHNHKKTTAHPKTFMRSKNFRNASLLSAGIVLGAAFSTVTGHNHAGDTDHSHYKQQHSHNHAPLKTTHRL